MYSSVMVGGHRQQGCRDRPRRALRRQHPTVNGVVEMHAVKLVDPSEQQASRVIDSDGPGEHYRCASQLAQMVAIDLEHG